MPGSGEHQFGERKAAVLATGAPGISGSTLSLTARLKQMFHSSISVFTKAASQVASLVLFTA